MKKISFLFCSVLLLLIVGCTNIGNGVSAVYKLDVSSPQVIDIEGDWRIEIICGSDVESCEIYIDENLKDSISVSSDDEFCAYLPSNVYPMVAPVLRLKLKKSFKELTLDGNNICRIKNYKSDALKAELEGNAVCAFSDCSISNVKAELSGKAKLSFAGELKNLVAELEENSLFEVSNVDMLKLECSDNSICRINKCSKAEIYAEDNAHVVFKNVKTVEYKAVDNARVDYPVVIPESLKK